MEAGGPRGGGRKGTTVLLRAIQILAGVEGLVEERNTVLLRAIQNTGRGGGGGGGAGWREDYSASPCHTKYFYYLHLSWCVRVGATRKL